MVRLGSFHRRDVTISRLVFSGGLKRTATVTFDFTSDSHLTLTRTLSTFRYSDYSRSFTIPVLVNGMRRLDVGSVTDQATEAGGTATFTVASGTPISGTVAVTSRDPSEGTESPSSRTFSTSNCNTAQTVTVRADGDADAQADVADLTHRVAGGGWATWGRLRRRS